ncbi:MAG: radical SAM protein [Promethearchaeota archaeon]|nr:MAG: radical SAM protein [Candidatus Lokiarchaeota archaeon]
MAHCIYGPFLSRRLGLSLGVDLLFQQKFKTCTYDCVYCEIGFTKKVGLSSINKRIKLEENTVNEIIERLKIVLNNERSIDSITIGYFGEPTLIDNLDTIVDQIKNSRNEANLNAPISIFTNSSTISNDLVRKNLSKTDRVIAKLDAADQNTFLRINRPHKTVPKISKIIDGLKKYKINYKENKLIIQTLLIEGKYKNTDYKNLKQLSAAFDLIKPDLIQLYSISRTPADKNVKYINKKHLNELKDVLIRNSENPKILDIQIY